jgi:hypothetical protein
MDKKEEPKQIQIELDDQTAQGAYFNLAFVAHSEAEFIIDLVFVQPQQPKGKVRARLITSPPHMKRLLKALEDNVKKYEDMHGPIKLGEQKQPPQEFNFKSSIN